MVSMSRRTWGLLVCVLAMTLAPGRRSEGAGGAEVDRKAVEALEHDWLKGISDRATLERVLANDFVHPVSAGVFLSKEQHIEWAVSHPRAAERKAEFERLDVRLFGETAIATGIVAETD